MMLVKMADLEGQYEVGHYGPDGKWNLLWVDNGKGRFISCSFDEAVSLAGRINGGQGAELNAIAQQINEALDTLNSMLAERLSK